MKSCYNDVEGADGRCPPPSSATSSVILSGRHKELRREDSGGRDE